MQESQYTRDQITFKANILPHKSSVPHLFVLFLLPVGLIRRHGLLLREMNKGDECLRACRGPDSISLSTQTGPLTSVGLREVGVGGH